MRLICGYVRFDGGAADPQLLQTMCEALGSGGLRPASSQRVEGPAACAMLDFAPNAATRELPTGPDGTWLAADIRLDDIHPAGENAAALEAFERWGADLPDHLNGDYGLAFWTPRRRRLTLARDIMGVRPLCYLHQPGKLLAFASIPRGIHESQLVATRLDLIALGLAQVQLTMPVDRTGWEGVQWLLPGHTLTASENGVLLRRAWNPDPSSVAVWQGSADDAAAELRSLVCDAVTARVRGSGAVAAHLSGGLDSSGIVVLAARQLREQGRRLHAWSVLTHPDVPVFSEAEWVNAVLDQERDIEWTPEYIATEPQDQPGDPDLPLVGFADTPDRRITAAAAASGASIVLSGVGGDEGPTYNGPAPYAELIRQKKAWHAFREARARARVERQPLLRSIYGRLVAPFLPEALIRLRRRSAGLPVREEMQSRTSRFLCASFRDMVLPHLPPPLDTGNDLWARMGKLREGLDERANRWAILGARYGVAFTYPLADRRILEFCLALPLERILEGGYARQPYRNAMRGILPEKVRLRTDKTANAGITGAMSCRHFAASLADADSLRHQPAVNDLFDFDAIHAALSEGMRNASDPKLPAAISLNPRVWFFNALHAQTALGLAGHIVRFAR